MVQTKGWSKAAEKVKSLDILSDTEKEDLLDVQTGTYSVQQTDTQMETQSDTHLVCASGMH